jgi:hypothetical protein
MILCENKRILRKKGSENFEANKRNACETDLCSLRFALKRKKNISENRTPYSRVVKAILWSGCSIVFRREVRSTKLLVLGENLSKFTSTVSGTLAD